MLNFFYMSMYKNKKILGKCQIYCIPTTGKTEILQIQRCHQAFNKGGEPLHLKNSSKNNHRKQNQQHTIKITKKITESNYRKP